MPLLDFCDFLTAKLMLPMGAFLTSIILGWLVNRQMVKDEFTNKESIQESFFPVYMFAIRYIVPLCIVMVFLHQFGIL